MILKRTAHQTEQLARTTTDGVVSDANKPKVFEFDDMGFGDDAGGGYIEERECAGDRLVYDVVAETWEGACARRACVEDGGDAFGDIDGVGKDTVGGGAPECVDMEIDEAWGDDLSLGVDCLKGAVGGDVLFDGGYFAVGERYVALGVEFL